MANHQIESSGARLAYVVLPLEGTVTRKVTRWSKEEGIHEVDHEEDAGFLVFFPRGHVMRLKDEKALMTYGLDRDPKFMDMKGLYDPNTAIGKLFSSQDDNERARSYRHLEDQVIRLATAKGGKGFIMPEQQTGEIDIPFPVVEIAEKQGAPTMLREHKMRTQKNGTRERRKEDLANQV